MQSKHPVAGLDQYFCGDMCQVLPSLLGGFQRMHKKQMADLPKLDNHW